MKEPVPQLRGWYWRDFKTGFRVWWKDKPAETINGVAIHRCWEVRGKKRR